MLYGIFTKRTLKGDPNLDNYPHGSQRRASLEEVAYKEFAKVVYYTNRTGRVEPSFITAPAAMTQQNVMLDRLLRSMLRLKKVALYAQAIGAGCRWPFVATSKRNREIFSLW